MSGVIYVRWQKDEPRRQREFPPLETDHPDYPSPCLMCNEPLGGNGRVQLVAVGPDDDPTSKAKHDAGKWYSAAGIVVHASCLRQMNTPALEAFIASLQRVEVADGGQ